MVETEEASKVGDSALELEWMSFSAVLAPQLYRSLKLHSARSFPPIHKLVGELSSLAGEG